MKKILFPLFLVVFALSSCGDLSKLTQFDMPLSQSVTINKDMVVANMPIDSIMTPAIETKSAEFFSTNNIKTDFIEKISLKEMKLIITSPTAGNFNFLKAIDISIVADSLAAIKIASLTDVPANASTSLQLTVSSDDLKPYLLKNSIKLKIKISADETIPADYTIDVKPTFLIDAKVLGL